MSLTECNVPQWESIGDWVWFLRTRENFDYCSLSTIVSQPARDTLHTVWCGLQKSVHENGLYSDCHTVEKEDRQELVEELVEELVNDINDLWNREKERISNILGQILIVIIIISFLNYDIILRRFHWSRHVTWWACSTSRDSDIARSETLAYLAYSPNSAKLQHRTLSNSLSIGYYLWEMYL